MDPYYLVHKSLELGYNPQVILSGRRINDGMPAFVAQRLVQILIQQGKNPGACKVLVMGITFKEDVADIRNSKVADLVRELMKFSVSVHITDPHASPNEVAHEYGLSLADQPSGDYDAVLVAVGHKDYLSHDIRWFKSVMNDKPVLVDLKGLYRKPEPEEGLVYWRL